ncbi:MAG TPA: glycosyltransferase family 2 protein [Thermoanaerobaculia bacterium]
MPELFAPCALVPAYGAEATVGAVVRGLRRHVPRVLVVDDGSADRTADAAREAGAEVLRLATNGGKGTALRAGLARLFVAAGAAAPTHVAFVDADGQHDPDDLPRLLEAARAGDRFVIGSRMGEADAIPAYRHRTNEIGSRILSRMTGLEIEDAQSGYRVVAADLLRRLALNARGYIIETEMLLKAAPHLRRFRHVPVRAIYESGPSGSHYRPFRDTWLISWGAVYYKVFEID